MSPRPNRRNGKGGGDPHKRLRIANEAGRIMAEEGVKDFHMAKRKAAERLNLSQVRNLPDNEEVQAALVEHLQLFHRDELARNTHRLRTIALEAMKFLAAFEPKLVGTVLSGTVTSGSEIQLHVSADTTEEVGFFLREREIPFRMGERRMRFGGERYKNIPTYLFTADGVTVELCIFDPRVARETPLSPVDGRPMERANLRELENLLTRN